MTSIEYGGQPSIEQRRRFCNGDPLGHVPGYTGFCPQLQYRQGRTFGNETASIAHELPYYKGPEPRSIEHRYPTIGCDKVAATRSVFSDEVPGRMIPRSTGDNKYIEGMIPGYSGDVPHLNFKFGSRYTHLTNECVDEFVRKYESNKKAHDEIQRVASLFPALSPIANDPRVRDRLRLWCDELAKSQARVKPIRGPTEPPIPGYQGFIPRMVASETGLGRRFASAANQSLVAFRDDCKNHFDRLDRPITSIDTFCNVQPNMSTGSEKPASSRIFHNSGMIPNYVGHVHGYDYESGKTYNATTKDLEVCSHKFPSYGEYLNFKRINRAGS